VLFGVAGSLAQRVGTEAWSRVVAGHEEYSWVNEQHRRKLAHWTSVSRRDGCVLSVPTKAREKLSIERQQDKSKSPSIGYLIHRLSAIGRRETSEKHLASTMRVPRLSLELP
jgi:hypothetical protein